MRYIGGGGGISISYKNSGRYQRDWGNVDWERTEIEVRWRLEERWFPTRKDHRVYVCSLPYVRTHRPKKESLIPQNLRRYNTYIVIKRGKKSTHHKAKHLNDVKQINQWMENNLYLQQRSNHNNTYFRGTCKCRYKNTSIHKNKKNHPQRNDSLYN